MEHIVKGCINCPFSSYTDRRGDFCKHPLSEEDHFIDGDYNFDPITPDWCPLNEEEITIKKQQ